MQAHGWRIIPINPNASEILGEPAYPTLTEAARICDEDVETNRLIGVHGLEIIRAIAARKAPGVAYPAGMAGRRVKYSGGSAPIARSALSTASSVALHHDTRVIGVVSVAHFLSHFFQLALPPLFPLLRAEFGTPDAVLGGMIGSFYVASGITQFAAGFVVDRQDGAHAAIPCSGLLWQQGTEDRLPSGGQEGRRVRPPGATTIWSLPQHITASQEFGVNAPCMHAACMSMILA